MLQEQASKMINDLSDDNVSFLIEIIQRLMPQKSMRTDEQLKKMEGIQALNRLKATRDEIKQYFPEDFDLDKELEEARAERECKLHYYKESF